MILNLNGKDNAPLIGVINYGAGNLGNVRRALDKLALRQILIESPAELQREDPALLLLPGVGAFRTAREYLDALGWPPILIEWANAGKPLLGICLGMQLLCSQSDEDGITRGLGLLDGNVTRLKGAVKTPHMGWNTLKWDKNAGSFAALAGERQNFYFVHSYAVELNSPHCIASTEVDNARFCSVMKNGSVAGFQFHPERSGTEGVLFLERALLNMIGGREA